ncbi:hypothetical protein ACOSP7_011510 [Xanthoceras sorbifolium]
MGSLQFEHETEKNSISVIKPLESEEFRRQGHMMIDFIADYYKNAEKYPVLSQVEPGYLRKLLPESAPYDPEPIETIIRDVKEHIVPGLTHWQRFLGEMLSTGFNVVGFNWMSSPAATELENIVMDWLGEMLNLPKSFLFSGNGGGVLQGTTCEAIGRENIGKLVVYGSDQTHSALRKAAHIAGIDPNNFRAIKTTKSSSFCLSPDSLQATINLDIEDGLIPLFLCTTIGTTGITAVDPIQPLCDVAKRYGVWIHIDAAYAGSACICPEFRHFLDGIEDADSFSFNAHKWFFTNLDCCCLWVRNPSALIQSLSTNPEFLRNKASDSKEVVDYKDWQITLSRRFRALKLWFVLRSYGVGNLRKFLRSHRFEVVAPRNFSMVCFRVSPSALFKNKKYVKGKAVSDDDDDDEKLAVEEEEEEKSNEVTKNLLEKINASGKAYMTHAMVGGIYVIRFAIGASLTEDHHVMEAWKVVQRHLDAILGDCMFCMIMNEPLSTIVLIS